MMLTPENIVFGLGIFLVLWYLFASIFNRRRGVAVFRWLQSGLAGLGGETAAKWIGSSGSGAQIQVRKADPPFKDLEIVYLLASRELLPLFLVDLLRGKRDRLIIKSRLRPTFPGEVEVVRGDSSLARQMRAEQDKPWSIEDGPPGLLVGARGPRTDELRAALGPLLEKYGAHILQVSWGRTAPHLIVIFALAGLYERGGSAAGLYADLTAAVTAAGQSAD